MFPHPGRAFWSYSRPPSSHIEQKSKKCSENDKLRIFPYFLYQPALELLPISEMRSPVKPTASMKLFKYSVPPRPQG